MPLVNERTFLKEYKRRARAVLPKRVVKVVLYGSRARGDAEVESDWDVAVFLKDAPQAEDRRLLSGVAFDIGLENNGVFIQTLALPISSVSEDSIFMERVRRDGVEI